MATLAESKDRPLVLRSCPPSGLNWLLTAGANAVPTWALARGRLRNSNHKTAGVVYAPGIPLVPRFAVSPRHETRKPQHARPRGLKNRATLQGFTRWREPWPSQRFTNGFCEE